MNIIILSVLVAQATAVSYLIETRTADLYESGTDSAIRAVIIGETGRTVKTGYFDNPDNDMENDEVNQYVLHNLADVGEIQCIQFITEGSDDWFVDWVSVYSYTNPDKKYMYNEQNTHLSEDSSEGSKTLTLCVKGEETYHVSTYTSHKSDAGSDAVHVKMKIVGTQGEALTGFLEHPGRDELEKGRQIGT